MADAEERLGRLSGHDVARLTEQIAGLSDAGLPLPSGLRALAAEQPSRRLRSTLGKLADALEVGEPLTDALNSSRSQLPPHLRGLVLAGVRTGRLSQVLGRYVGYTSLRNELRNGLWLSLAIPFIAWIIALGALWFVFGVLANSFGNIFRDFGIALPWITRVVVNISHIFTEYGWMLRDIVSFFAIVAVLLYAFLSTSTLNSLFTLVPLLGPVWRYTALAEFCHLLSLLLESALPLNEALRLTADGVQDDRIKRACVVLANDVDSGLSLTRAIDQRPFFPKGLTRILAWAERSHSLPEALTMSAELFESRAKSQAIATSMICGVLTVVLLLLGIGFTIIALFLPLLTLLTKLSG